MVKGTYTLFGQNLCFVIKGGFFKFNSCFAASRVLGTDSSAVVPDELF